MTTLNFPTSKPKQVLANCYKLDSSASYSDKYNVNGSAISARINGGCVTVSSDYFMQDRLIEECFLPSVVGIKTVVSALNKQCNFARVYLNFCTMKLTFAQFADAQSYCELAATEVEVFKFVAYKGKVTMQMLKDAIIEELGDFLNK